jgi:hypothetical protein
MMRGRHCEDGRPNPLESVGNTLGNGSSEGTLLEWRQMILGRSTDLNAQVAEAQAVASD